jgi:hypothetical protein
MGKLKDSGGAGCIVVGTVVDAVSVDGSTGSRREELRQHFKLCLLFAGRSGCCLSVVRKNL